MNELTEIKDILLRNRWKASTCESITCGLVASLFGSVPGISKVYAGGLITYMTEEKHILAGVSESTLDRYGAISEETAVEMCLGTSAVMKTNVAVSVTGNAGPEADENKPVGLVYIGVSVNGKAEVKEYHFHGNRDEIRHQAANTAVIQLYEALQKEG